MEAMSDEPTQTGWKTSARGEAGWQAAKEEIAGRNQSARKAGKDQREAAERSREDSRRAAEVRRHAKIVGGRRKREG
jgi:hypothetical protein